MHKAYEGPVVKTLLQRTAVFVFWTFVRFMLIIGIGLLYCKVRGIPFPERVPDDIRMLIFRVIPATAVGHAAALLLLWARRGSPGILSSKQSALAALLCAVLLDSAYLFGTPYMSGMVLRRSVHLACALLVTLSIGLLWGTKPKPLSSSDSPLANEPMRG
jgi:hypothetical protein